MGNSQDNTNNNPEDINNPAHTIKTLDISANTPIDNIDIEKYDIEPGFNDNIFDKILETNNLDLIKKYIATREPMENDDYSLAITCALVLDSFEIDNFIKFMIWLEYDNPKFNSYLYNPEVYDCLCDDLKSMYCYDLYTDEQLTHIIFTARDGLLTDPNIEKSYLPYIFSDSDYCNDTIYFDKILPYYKIFDNGQKLITYKAVLPIAIKRKLVNLSRYIIMLMKLYGDDLKYVYIDVSIYFDVSIVNLFVQYDSNFIVQDILTPNQLEIYNAQSNNLNEPSHIMFIDSNRILHYYPKNKID